MAEIRTIDYKGFNFATGSGGSPGFLIYSGSLELGSEVSSITSYTGVGIEAIGSSESFLRFRTVPNELDIRASQFFVGTEASQFVSGSSGNIEISSSNFHLKPDGGLIIGGDTVINASLSTNELFTPAGTDASDARAFISSTGVAKFAGDGAGNYKVSLDGTGTSTIGGWTIGDDKLQGNNIIISSSGAIQTSNFVSSVVGGQAGSGYRIGADGIAEFEQARVRGTLSTAVFEKETVSAVGGALIVANATAVKSGSLIRSNLVDITNIASFTSNDDNTIDSATQVTFNSTTNLDRLKPIIADNNTMIPGRVYRAKATISSYGGSGTIGFSTDGGISNSEGRRSSNGEIDTIFTYTSGQVHVFSNTNNTGVISNITIEEMSIPVDNTSGFVVGEYILAKATSSNGFTEEVMRIASMESASIDLLIVSRSMNGNLIQSMSAGQTLVSQGSNGTGFILLNATSGSETPYIDITERTGTGVNDLQVKSRLGDLSGISDSSFSSEVEGFGLYTDNGFFKGKIEVASIPQIPTVQPSYHYNFMAGTGSLILNQASSDVTNHSGSIINATQCWVSESNSITGNSAIQFVAGQNSRIELEDRSPYFPGGSTINIFSCSLAVWLKPENVSHTEPQIIWEAGGQTNGFALYVSESVAWWSAWRASGNHTMAVSASIPSGVYSHIGATYSHGTGSIYVNGTKQATAIGSTEFNTLGVSFSGFTGIAATHNDSRIIHTNAGVQNTNALSGDGKAHYTGSMDGLWVYWNKILTDNDCLTHIVITTPRKLPER